MSSFHRVRQNNLLETKIHFGEKCLDNIFGYNGMPLGSVLLLEEDKYALHSLSISKIYLAEGITENHALFIGSKDMDPRKITLKLPQSKEIQQRDDEKSSQSSLTSRDEMKIAWRYDNLPQYDSAIKESKRTYDFSKNIDEKILNDHGNITYWDGYDEPLNENSNQLFGISSYASLLTALDKKIKECKEKNLYLRIFIQSLGSPVWYSENFQNDLLKFFVILKSMIRNSTSTCIVTFPAHLLTSIQNENDQLIEKIENLCDFVFELVSISRYDKLATIFKDCSGLFNIKKISSINCLSHNFKGSYDLSYTLSRSFKIETLHLPPDIGEDNNSPDTVTTKEVDLSCGSSQKRLLEF